MRIKFIISTALQKGCTGKIMKSHHKQNYETMKLITGHTVSMINADQYRSMTDQFSEIDPKYSSININANQWRSISINTSQFFSMAINADQCWSMPPWSPLATIVFQFDLILINWHWTALIGIDERWSFWYFWKPTGGALCRGISSDAAKFVLKCPCTVLPL